MLGLQVQQGFYITNENLESQSETSSYEDLIHDSGSVQIYVYNRDDNFEIDDIFRDENKKSLTDENALENIDYNFKSI